MIWDILEVHGTPEVAQVYVLASKKRALGHWVECVDAKDPRFPRSQKWVVIVSSQFGCPLGCIMCDAAKEYQGDLSEEEILGQVDWVMEQHRLDGGWECPKIKIHFARMGEPSLNPAVIEVLRQLPGKYPGAAFLPVVATVAPTAGALWLDDLARVKEEHYTGGRFQLQFSVNSTDEAVRDKMMPVRKWMMTDIARFGETWWRPGDRKITLNFALAEGVPFDTRLLAGLFDSDRFLVKVTPLNPTLSVRERGLRSVLTFSKPEGAPPFLQEAVRKLESEGFEVILSVGSAQEIEIGSNCGQLVSSRLARGRHGEK